MDFNEINQQFDFLMKELTIAKEYFNIKYDITPAKSRRVIYWGYDTIDFDNETGQWILFPCTRDNKKMGIPVDIIRVAIKSQLEISLKNWLNIRENEEWEAFCNSPIED